MSIFKLNRGQSVGGPEASGVKRGNATVYTLKPTNRALFSRQTQGELVGLSDILPRNPNSTGVQDRNVLLVWRQQEDGWEKTRVFDLQSGALFVDGRLDSFPAGDSPLTSANVVFQRLGSRYVPTLPGVIRELTGGHYDVKSDVQIIHGVQPEDHGHFNDPYLSSVLRVLQDERQDAAGRQRQNLEQRDVVASAGGQPLRRQERVRVNWDLGRTAEDALAAFNRDNR